RPELFVRVGWTCFGVSRAGVLSLGFTAGGKGLYAHHAFLPPWPLPLLLDILADSGLGGTGDSAAGLPLPFLAIASPFRLSPTKLWAITSIACSCKVFTNPFVT